MPELLLFAYDFSKDLDIENVKHLACKPAPFDLVAWHPDGEAWGGEETANPRFRILAWPSLKPDFCNSLLLPEFPTLDTAKAPLTVLQYRQQHLNFNDLGLAAQLPAGFADWWSDDRRKAPILTIDVVPDVTIIAAVVVKPPIAASIALDPIVVSPPKLG